MSKGIPEGWQIRQISEICNIAIGGTPSRSISEYWDPAKKTGNLWVSIRDLNTPWIYETSEYITELGIKESNVKLVKQGTVLMSFKLSVGRVAFAGRDLYTNEAIVAFLPKNKNLLSNKFLYQGLQQWNLLENVDQAVKGVTLNKEKINQIDALLPPLPEQQKIAAILSSVDDVIEKTRAQIDKLKDLKTGMMQELLTKGIGHTEFKDSTVGRIPKNWQYLYMKDICSVRQGLQIPISERYSTSGCNRWVYLTIRYINTAFDKSVAEYIENPKPSVICTEDDIILARTGATGKVVTGLRGVFHNNFFMIDYDRSKVVKNFLVQYLSSPFVQHEIINRAGTTTIPDLNHGDFYTIPMLLPPVDEQLRLAKVLGSLDVLISQKKSKYISMEKIKKALMQDLLTGKVRVNVD